ncbi:DUF3649 domain-containing protein [Azoarcus sp. L1K30]|uniref:DUF3649 domain-containing protein n=1 Tax=Azoarcus sp. L1K30 TaxID=2820277 RepID=UPI001B815112|nr:DUF3649 domain-containing protein [Azoarcus sp. L1K30]MBR0564958.1 DUF3649 domain-containing protein [Azoarcus sp. L1K30]
MSPHPTQTRPRLALISRIVAALIGGYALASVFSIFLSHLLPSELPEAVLGATLFSFAIYTAAIIWVFAAASAARAWLGLLIPGALMGLLSCAMQFAGSAT